MKCARSEGHLDWGMSSKVSILASRRLKRRIAQCYNYTRYIYMVLEIASTVTSKEVYFVFLSKTTCNPSNKYYYYEKSKINFYFLSFS